MIEVRVRHEHEVELRQLVGRERGLDQAQGARGCRCRGPPRFAGYSTGSVMMPTPVEVDEDGRVAQPRERDRVVVPGIGRGSMRRGRISRPHSAMRSRRKRALHEFDRVVHAAPALARAPVASTLRRVMEGFITFRDYRRTGIVPSHGVAAPATRELGDDARGLRPAQANDTKGAAPGWRRDRHGGWRTLLRFEVRGSGFEVRVRGSGSRFGIAVRGSRFEGTVTAESAGRRRQRWRSNSLRRTPHARNCGANAVDTALPIQF